MRVFFAGGTGFIAAHVIKLLSERGHTITVAARNPERYQPFAALPGVRMVAGDIDDRAFLDRSLPGHDTCVTNVLSWGEGAVAMLINDTRRSVALFETAVAAGISNFLYTSSTAAIGDFRHDMTEEFIAQPIDYYCATKRASELFLLAVSHKTSMRCNIIRPGLTFGNPAFEGAREHTPDGSSVFCRVVNAAVANRTVEVMERMGTQFISANDIARVYLAVLEGSMNRQIYHALGKPWYSDESIARKAIELSGSSSAVVLTANPDPGRPKEFTLEKIKHEFGFEFDSWPFIVSHLQYLIARRRAGG